MGEVAQGPAQLNKELPLFSWPLPCRSGFTRIDRVFPSPKDSLDGLDPLVHQPKLSIRSPNLEHAFGGFQTTTMDLSEGQPFPSKGNFIRDNLAGVCLNIGDPGKRSPLESTRKGKPPFNHHLFLLSRPRNTRQSLRFATCPQQAVQEAVGRLAWMVFRKAKKIESFLFGAEPT